MLAIFGIIVNPGYIMLVCLIGLESLLVIKEWNKSCPSERDHWNT